MYTHTHTYTCTYIHADSWRIIVCVGPFKCYIMLNIQFNVPYKSCRSFLCPPMNCLTPASRACLSVPKSCPAQSLFLPLYPHTLLSQSHFVFVFCFFLLLFCLAFCFCFFFFFVPVIVSFSFKPLSNACSFLLAAPVDGLHLFSIRFGVFLLCSHIFITAYRFQAKD